MRRGFIVGLIALIVVLAGGCLFPDFDKFDTGSEDAASPVLSKSIQCGDASTCIVDFQFCCSNMAACFDIKQPALCPDVDGTTKLRFFCDGQEDCPSGQVCCFTKGTPDVACKATCEGGSVVCTGNGEGQRGNCPSGKACTGSSMPLGHRSCE